jgi:hypothetical protein
VSVTALLDRSRSRSMSADLVNEKDRWVLYYMYNSVKGTLARGANPPARGAAELLASTEPTTQLEGDYWTEQGTRGQIKTVGHSRKLFETFEAARTQGSYEASSSSRP